VFHDDHWVKAHAYFLIDLGLDHDLQWVCFLDASGECWTIRNPNVRLRENVTMGRTALPEYRETSPTHPPGQR
jgi:hypothetical protein